MNILDAIYERDTRLDLLVYFVHMHRHNHVFVYKLIYSIFVKVLVNCSRGNGVKLIRAIEHICLYHSKDRGILLKTVGGGVGSVSCDSSLYLTESCFIFSTIFQT